MGGGGWSNGIKKPKPEPNARGTMITQRAGDDDGQRKMNTVKMISVVKSKTMNDGCCSFQNQNHSRTRKKIVVYFYFQKQICISLLWNIFRVSGVCFFALIACNIEKWVAAVCTWWSTPTLMLYLTHIFLICVIFCCCCYCCLPFAHAYWLSWNVLHAYCLVTPLQYITLRFQTARFRTRAPFLDTRHSEWWQARNDEQIKIYTQSNRKWMSISHIDIEQNENVVGEHEHTDTSYVYEK